MLLKGAPTRMGDRGTTLFVLADASVPTDWRVSLERAGFSIRSCATEQELRHSIADQAGLILIRSGPQYELPELLTRLSLHTALPLLLIQTQESPDLASAARTCGVGDYLREPVSGAELVASVERCLAAPRPTRAFRHPLCGSERMVGAGAAMTEVRNRIARIAATDCNVLITGETGTGKELAAELIHANSRRRSGRLVCVNCAALPEGLVESELFGYERGAFTGAHSARPGHLEMADGGVVFLDEVGELSLQAQAKILRAIDGKEVQRLGTRSGAKVDVRMVCATNRNLETDVAAGKFRADLFFRLNVARLEMPPLRERKEDLHELAEHYLRELNARMNLQVHSFSAHSWRSLLSHDWPGNVREFRNVIEASLVRMPYPAMRVAELPEEFHRRFGAPQPVLSEPERLVAALVCHNWNKSKAAEALQWSRMTLYRKMAKYQLTNDGKSRAKTA